MRFLLAPFLLSLFILTGAKAQETLPGFTVSQKTNGKVVVSWRNAYPAINQISIQRSTDSLHNFSTLITVPDPHTPENGFVDGKAQGKRFYYRIFILFGNSRYMFTKSKRAIPEAEVKAKPPETKPKPQEAPVVSKGKQSREKTKSGRQKQEPPAITEAKPEKTETVPAISKTPSPKVETVPVKVGIFPEKPVVILEKPEAPIEEDLNIPKIDNSRIFYLQDKGNLKKPEVSSLSKLKAPAIEVEKILFVKRRDSVIMLLPGNHVRRFSDSLLKQTKDTLWFVNADTLMIKPFVAPPEEIRDIYKISAYVFTAKDGNVNISLPDFSKKKYSVQFFEEDHTPLLEIKNINNRMLIIDKTNFMHSGWFRFELYEDGKLREKNKLFIPKEF